MSDVTVRPQRQPHEHDERCEGTWPCNCAFRARGRRRTSLTLREVAARALCALDGERDPDYRGTHGIPEWEHWIESAETALAAVAADDGLMEVLLAHDAVTESDCIRSCRCGWTTYPGHWPTRREFAAHLADVVRAWITGQEGA